MFVIYFLVLSSFHFPTELLWGLFWKYAILTWVVNNAILVIWEKGHWIRYQMAWVSFSCSYSPSLWLRPFLFDTFDIHLLICSTRIRNTWSPCLLTLLWGPNKVLVVKALSNCNVLYTILLIITSEFLSDYIASNALFRKSTNLNAIWSPCWHCRCWLILDSKRTKEQKY